MLPAMEEASTRLKSCPDCAAQMPVSAGFCPGCGRVMRSASAAAPTYTSRVHNFAAAFSYFTFIPALVFLFVGRYRSDSLVRFHSVQCLLCWLTGIALALLLRILGLLLLFVPVIGPLLAVLIVAIVSFAVFLLWIVLIVKAFRGEQFALPLLGLLALRYSSPA